MKYIVAVILALCFSSTALASDNIIIVLDTSGSMGDHMRSARATRMVVAQNALVEVLSKVPDTTKVGILTFDGWIYELDFVDRMKIEKAIRSTRPSGGTPLYQFMREGGTSLLTEREDQLNVGSYKLLVITDGQASDDKLNRSRELSDGSVKLGVLDDVMSRNIVVDTIALNMNSDHPLKNTINGTYMKGDDPDSLTKAMTQAVAEVGFGDSQDASEDAFKDIAELPIDGSMAILQGLSTFPNHPIGEKPKIAVVKDDGTVVMQEDPTNVEFKEDEGISFGFILGFIGIIILGGLIILGVLAFIDSQ